MATRPNFQGGSPLQRRSAPRLEPRGSARKGEAWFGEAPRKIIRGRHHRCRRYRMRSPFTLAQDKQEWLRYERRRYKNGASGGE